MRADPRQLPGRRLLATFARFFLSGLANTALTYALYLLLLPFAGYAVSYSIAFVLGIALAFLLSRSFVFKSVSRSRRQFLFPGVYLLQYLAGLAVVAVWVEWLGLPEPFAPLAAIALTIPLTFAASRWVFSAAKST